MATYSISQVIGKTFIATRNVKLYRLPSDDSPVVYTVLKGQPIGNVYSFLYPASGRKYLYWMFYDANKKPFYCRHDAGAFSFEGQGALTLEEEREIAERAGSIIDKVNDAIDGVSEGAGDTATTLNNSLKLGIYGGLVFLGFLGIKKLQSNDN